MINLRPFVVVLGAILLSCGGGSIQVAGTGGGVGTGGTGVVIGTVTGLGSVIVDGVRYDESHASLDSQPDLVSSSALALSDLHIGQHVELTLDATATPTRVRVQSQLVGPVASVDAASARLVVWGEQVLVNNDPSQGPITVFSGYSSIADVQAGDALQVYGSLQAGTSATDVLHATRIERISSGALPARISGSLQAGGSGGFLLEGRALDVSAVAPAPALSAGEAVVAIVPWTSGSSGPWRASAVAPIAPSLASGATISGAAHLLSATTVEVQGTPVDLSSLSSTARQQIREGGYVTVQVDAQSKATDANPQPASGRPAQLRGTISSIAGSSFVLRGQSVDASKAQFTGGTAASLAVGTYVEVQGTQGVTGITASSVAIDAAPPEGAVVEVTGTVVAVDGTTRQVQLKLANGSAVTAVLPAQATLPKTGEVRRFDGYWQSGVLQVRDSGG